LPLGSFESAHPQEGHHVGDVCWLPSWPSGVCAAACSGASGRVGAAEHRGYPRLRRRPGRSVPTARSPDSVLVVEEAALRPPTPWRGWRERVPRPCPQDGLVLPAGLVAEAPGQAHRRGVVQPRAIVKEPVGRGEAQAVTLVIGGNGGITLTEQLREDEQIKLVALQAHLDEHRPALDLRYAAENPPSGTTAW
jgi:hypothetical protein